DGVRAADCDGFKLFGLDLYVLAFADFVALHDVRGIDLVSALRVHFEIFDAVPSILVDLMKADFLPFAGRRIQSDGTRDEREFEVAFPIRAGGHGLLLSMSDTAPTGGDAILFRRRDGGICSVSALRC